jgi:hypothetical protein
MRALYACAVPAAITLTATGLLGCTGQTNGLGPVDGGSETAADGPTEEAPEADVGDVVDAADVADVVSEASPQYSCNAHTCGGACCQDQCVPRSCAGCATGNIFCPTATVFSANGYCTTSCAACVTGADPAPVACFDCSGGQPLGSCRASAASCPAAPDAGACGCASGQCPGANQTCETVDGQQICVTH